MDNYISTAQVADKEAQELPNVKINYQDNETIY